MVCFTGHPFILQRLTSLPSAPLHSAWNTPSIGFLYFLLAEHDGNIHHIIPESLGLLHRCIQIVYSSHNRFYSSRTPSDLSPRFPAGRIPDRTFYLGGPQCEHPLGQVPRQSHENE